MSQMEQPQTGLPREAVDHGDRVEVSPPRGRRLLTVTIGAVFVVVGIVLVAVAPGDLGDNPAVRFGVGGAFALAGLAAAASSKRRLDIDQNAVTLRGAFGSRSVPWSRVSELRVEQQWQHTTTHHGGVRGPGGVTIGTGGGNRSGRGMTHSRGTSRRVVSLRVRGGRDDRDITVGLGDASVASGEALVSALRGRRWVPDHVTVTVDTDA